MMRTKRVLPPAGTKLNGKFLGHEYYAEVVEAPHLKGGSGILYHGKIFRSMTAAAKQITKRSVNGRRFWRF